MPVADYDSSGRPINYVAITPRERRYICHGVCGRENIPTYSYGQKYCERRLCQEKKRTDDLARRARRKRGKV